MKIPRLLLLMIIFISALSIQAQDINDLTTNPGYYGFFADAEADFTLVTRENDKLRMEYYPHKYIFKSTSRILLFDRWELSGKTEILRRINHGNLTYHTANSTTIISKYNTALDLEFKSIFNFYDSLNLYLATKYYYSKSTFDYDTIPDETFDWSTWDYTAGLSIEGEKGIRLLTPGYVFQNGLFAELLYSNYFQYKFDGRSSDSDRSSWLANLSYSSIHRNFMITPGCYNIYLIDREILTSTPIISTVWDYSKACRFDLSFGGNFAFSEGYKTEYTLIGVADLHTFFKFQPVYLDFFLGYQIQRHPEKSSTYSEAKMGLQILLGYI
ncbi:MAG: hypothetical protein RAO94_07180 [Candidatus Stygibacter australis]|nr:hypothetical protein [Candidatus Stygibacter australis]MDP8322115.1 hypothetical protein [Candidatus Stygibacter australis]